MTHYCHVGTYLETLYAHEFITQVLEPGYTNETLARALIPWISVFTNLGPCCRIHPLPLTTKTRMPSGMRKRSMRRSLSSARLSLRPIR